MIGLKEKIMKRIRGHGKGSWVFSAKDFLDLGGRAATDQALSRLQKKGEIRRVGRGLYDWPRYSKLLGRFAPVGLGIAVKAIERRDGIRVMDDGITAAHRLGLTNAVPAKPVYWTDGRSRSVRVGGHSVQFKHVRPSLISWSDSVAAPLISALSWFGRSFPSDDEVVEKLKRQLSPEMRKDLRKRAAQIPGWALPIASELSNERLAT